MNRKPYKGKFTSFENPQKYLGDITNCIYRSSWERAAFRWCDLNENVKQWASEEISIYYQNPVTNRKAKYYPDLFIVTKIDEILVVEIKPSHQVTPPETPASGRRTAKYVNEMSTYLVNEAKWIAAKEICDKNGFNFTIWTEKELEQLGIQKMKVDGKTLLKEKNTKSRATPKRKFTRPKRKS